MCGRYFIAEDDTAEDIQQHNDNMPSRFFLPGMFISV